MKRPARWPLVLLRDTWQSVSREVHGTVAELERERYGTADEAQREAYGQPKRKRRP